MRVLHLVDVHSSCSGPILQQAVRSCIESMPEHEHLLLEVGGGGHTVLGDQAIGRIPPLRTFRPLTGTSHPLTQFLHAQSARVDLVHSWGQASTSLSATCCGGWPRIAMLDAFSLTPAFTRELCVASDMVLCCTVLGAARRLIDSGVTATRVHHLPPVVQWPASKDRAVCRDHWGACDDTIVLGVFDEPRGTAGLRQVAHVVSRLGLLGERVRLVVSPDSARIEDTHRWLRVLGFPDTAVEDAAIDQAWNVIDGIDVVVVGGGRNVEIAGSAGLCLARSAGRPILLGSGHPAVEEEQHSDDVFVECDRHEDKASAWVRSRWRSMHPVLDATCLADGVRELYRAFDSAITPASVSQASGAVS